MIIYTLLYNIAIRAYFVAIRIAALFDPKAKLFINGRKGLLHKIKDARAGEARQSIWMHCASLGEFEQGRPVLEALREQYPQYAIIITFFSPSGYEVRKSYAGADHVFYLPMDTSKNAEQFLDAVRPALCLFVKYEFWYYYLKKLDERNIPSLLISAIFSKQQIFFRWYGGLSRKMLRCFSHVFVQDAGSKKLLERIKITGVTVSGDTRFDRVIKAAAHTTDQPLARLFVQGSKILVAGSTWKEDEEFLHKTLSLLPADWKLILVPHEVNEAHIVEIEGLFIGEEIKWSVCDHGISEEFIRNGRVLLVDRVGILLELYKYATVAWIGGGFGKDGVHNVLEAAVYGVPCFYGPVFHQFIEATTLIEKGGAFTINKPADFVTILQEMEDSTRYLKHADAARAYVLAGSGATKYILNQINYILGKGR